MKRILKNALTCFLCIALLAGNISLPVRAAASGGYTADEIVEEILERLDAEIVKRPAVGKFTIDASDMGIRIDSPEWKYAYEEIFNRTQLNDYNKTFFTRGIGSYKTSDGFMPRLDVYIYPDFIDASTGNINWAKIDYFAELVDSEVEVALSLLTDDMTIAEKALILQNYVCMSTVYECVAFWYLPVGVFANGQAKCTGYARAYSTLLHAAGIENKVVESEEINHAWVMIRLEDGTWYHTDPTWDDTDDETAIRYTYFLNGDGQYKEHHLSWDGIVPTASKDYAFKDYAFYDLQVPLNYYNGDWYYLDQGVGQSYIVKTEFDGSNQEKIPLNDIAVNMVGYKDKLYYNTATQVYEYNIATGTKRLFYDISDEYPGEQIISFVIKHGMQLVLEVSVGWNSDPREIEIDLEPTEWERAFLTTDAIKFTESGETKQLGVTFVPFYADSFPGISWRSENQSVARVSADGFVTAAGEGTTTIIATTSDGKEVGRCKVEVDYGIQITGFEILDEKLVLNNIGDGEWVSYSFTPNEATDYSNLIWESEDPSVAQVDKMGCVTAVYYGKTVITATTKDGRFSDSCEVVVDPDAVKAVHLDFVGHAYLYMIGQTKQLTAEVYPETVSDKRIIWSSSDPNVATVNENGLVTVVGGGECKITATAVNGGKSSSCTIHAEIPDEWGILPSQRVPATTVNLNVVKKEVTRKYETIQLAATVEPMEASHKMIIWKSTNPSVAVVDSTGLVTVIGKGNCVISATTGDGSCSELCQISADWEEPEKNVDAEQLSKVTSFVERMYTIILNRTADAKGVEDWTQMLIDKKADGATIANGFVNSDEFVARNLSDNEYISVLYQAFLNRDADEAGIQSWLAVMNNGASRQNVLDGFIYSDEFSGLCKSAGISAAFTAEDAVRDFVERMYTVVLNRAADESGLDSWIRMLINQEADGATIGNGFINSDEFINRNLSDAAYVDVLYATFLGRAADESGINTWIGEFAKGATRQEVMNGFIKSTEFAGICDSAGIVAVFTAEDMVRSFVERMYTVALNRPADTAGVEDWTKALINQEVNGAQLAAGFIDGDEFKARGLNDSDYLNVLYCTFFNREADADKSVWMSALADGWTRREVLKGFVNSEEFKALCEKYGITRGELN